MIDVMCQNQKTRARKEVKAKKTPGKKWGRQALIRAVEQR
jgi:hypothetical protein